MILDLYQYNFHLLIINKEYRCLAINQTAMKLLFQTNLTPL